MVYLLVIYDGNLEFLPASLINIKWLMLLHSGAQENQSIRDNPLLSNIIT